MSQIHHSRYSKHPFLDRVWQSQNVTDGTYLATPDGSWDLIVMIEPGLPRRIMLAGQFTEPMDVPYRAGTGSVVLSFAAGTYLPGYSGKKMRGLVEMLPCTDGQFELCGKTFDMPTYKTAEAVVDSMIEQGVLKMDEVVASILNGNTKALSDRAKQRHFSQVTGLTRKSLEQIRRAQEAIRQLQEGKRPADVAVEAGFADQAHLSKSLQKIMHRPPSNVDEIHKL